MRSFDIKINALFNEYDKYYKGKWEILIFLKHKTFEIQSGFNDKFMKLRE